MLRLAVIMDGGGGNESPKLWLREVFIRGGDRHDDICVYGSAVVGGEAGRQ